jgi:16S rRNA (cytosine1402-N4)-methyltransferase
LLDEVIEALCPRPGKVYCDGTAGGGGHLSRIIAAGANAIGIDRDPVAIEAVRARLPAVRMVHARYAQMAEVLAGEKVDGILLDLGVSSPQLDRAERGFSFRGEGPLDMRMDTSAGETAEALIRRVGVDELADMLRHYGEERYAGRIARAIKEGVQSGAITTTTEMAAVIAQTVPTHERKKDPATRTFQALRIVVNHELEQLERFLDDFLALLKPGGRIAVIAFHSLEDVQVKNRFRDLAKDPGLPVDVALKMGVDPYAKLKLLTRKPLVPSDEEVARNPRARSAKLRAAEKI